jgi:hypothetical protein
MFTIMLEEKDIYSGELCLYLEEIGIFSTASMTFYCISFELSSFIIIFKEQLPFKYGVSAGRIWML